MKSPIVGENKKIVIMDDFEDAKDKVIGTQNKSKIISDSEKEVIAYHEAGHALANLIANMLIRYINHQLYQQVEL